MVMLKVRKLTISTGKKETVYGNVVISHEAYINKVDLN